MEDRDVSPAKKKAKRGYLNPNAVKGFAFFIIAICIVVSVVASILAIWQFAETDVLWRTVATCVVVAAGVGVFTFINSVFGDTK